MHYARNRTEINLKKKKKKGSERSCEARTPSAGPDRCDQWTFCSRAHVVHDAPPVNQTAGTESRGNGDHTCGSRRSNHKQYLSLALTLPPDRKLAYAYASGAMYI